jgi:hypothetical protein
MLAVPAIAALGLVTMQGVEAAPAVADLLVVLVFSYLFQGIATVHRTVGSRGMSGAWLVGMYGLLILMPQMFLFLACLGMLDSWLRPRRASGNGSEPE